MYTEIPVGSHNVALGDEEPSSMEFEFEFGGSSSKNRNTCTGGGIQGNHGKVVGILITVGLGRQRGSFFQFFCVFSNSRTVF